MGENPQKLVIKDGKMNSVEIYNEIENRIVTLNYKPGELLNEKQLIEEFEVSRTPIREALLKLSEKGLVEMVPRVGTYVSQIDLNSIRHAYEIKKYMEALAAELAALRATEDEIDQIVSIVEEMEQYDPDRDYEKYIEYDYLFRKKIREASKNPMLIQYLEDLNTKTSRFIRHIKYKVEDISWYKESLNAIAISIKERDSIGASEETKKHSIIFLEELSKRFFL
ncbi:GntR family transcriptional regulator [Dethiothermospora halolimnae]|uniref:GntR family transcriptional regulator n=1 Tax=Dethiothermospora halolimnae TaxID=3114390 RepID=UPI003CCB990E